MLSKDYAIIKHDATFGFKSQYLCTTLRIFLYCLVSVNKMSCLTRINARLKMHLQTLAFSKFKMPVLNNKHKSCLTCTGGPCEEHSVLI